jgi:hypothetical protein
VTVAVIGLVILTAFCTRLHFKPYSPAYYKQRNLGTMRSEFPPPEDEVPIPAALPRSSSTLASSPFPSGQPPPLEIAMEAGIVANSDTGKS